MKEAVKDFCSGVGVLIYGVVAIINDFGFDDWDNAGFLTFVGVARKNLAVYFDSRICRSEDVTFFIEADFECGAPFGETKSHLIIFTEASIETF